MTDRPGRLLIVDDEVAVVDVLREYFMAQGYAVETASNGADAVAAVQRRSPDLVLLDLRMPGMDGLETLKRLRALNDRLSVIMVTANEDAELARELLRLGAFDYVAKPFDFAYLDSVVAAGVVQATPLEAMTAPAGNSDPWHALLASIFRIVRQMRPAECNSTGRRLEDLALRAAHDGVAGRMAEAADHLRQIELLLCVAAELGDLSPADRAAVETALQGVGRALPA
jgi:two-component system response regulator (stage 0 sporulation protein F)